MMRHLEDRTEIGLSLICWFVCLALVGGLTACERGGDGEAPESEAQQPAAESSGEDDNPDESGAAADKPKEGAEEKGGDEEKPAGDPMPELKARTLEGETVRLEPTSEATLVNLWATWCAPCIAEFPEFAKLRNKWGDRGLRLVGLSIQDKDAKKRVTTFVDKREMPFDQVLYAAERDPLKVVGGGAVPASFLYDADGKLVWWHGSMVEGPEITSLESKLEGLLGAGSK